ncbi:MAG: hypothetical protein N2Z72_03550 [Bacteroidales bacterium]|nr:hypothetical protein [Bacteroidales bacterium]
MKNIVYVLFIFMNMILYSQVAINNTGVTPHPSAVLDLQTTDKGLLIPRVSLTQTTSSTPIINPATSLLIYNTATINDVTPGFYYWNGNAWVRLNDGGSTGNAWLLNGNSGTIPGTQFLGTTDNNALVIKTANTERLRVTSDGKVGIGISTPAERLEVSGNIRFSGALMPSGNAGVTGQALISQGSGTSPSWGSPAGGNVVSVSLATNQTLNSTTWADVPGMSLNFTALSDKALVIFTASGYGPTNSMGYISFRIWNVTSNSIISGTEEKIQSYDDMTGTVTTWSCSTSKLLTGLVAGNNYTIKVQYKVSAIWGTASAVVNPSSYPDEDHMTLSVIR